MNTITPPFPVIEWKLSHPIIPISNPLKKIKFAHGIVLNVDVKDSLIRVGIALLLPMLLLFTNKNLIIYISPVIFYLFVSALTKFCIVKHVWHRYIKHDPKPVALKYGKDPNYPDESV